MKFYHFTALKFNTFFIKYAKCNKKCWTKCPIRGKMHICNQTAHLKVEQIELVIFCDMGGFIMRLVVLIDICTINGRNLKGEGGASYYIEDEDKKFLLDTGASGLFMENAKNLDINLDDIDTVVLSHGHYDHAGGLKDFIESRDDKINIICHPLSFNKKKKGYSNMENPFIISLPDELSQLKDADLQAIEGAYATAKRLDSEHRR